MPLKGTYQKNKTLVVALAVLAWFGVLLQLYLSLHSATENGKGLLGGIVSYFGYFTIVTNFLVCISLTAPLIAPASSAGRFFARSDVTAGVATSIVFVGVAYHILLRNVWHPHGLDYPTAYLIYMLTRGLVIGSYPYGFIDPKAIGYQRTLVNAVGLLIAFIAIGLILTALGRIQRRASA